MSNAGKFRDYNSTIQGAG
jgi:hypothetical protein